MARSPKGPGLVWIGVVCFSPGCDVPGGLFLLGSTRDRGSVRVRLQSRAGRPVAAGAHASRLGQHGGGPYPPGAHRPRGLPKLGVPAWHSLTSGRCPLQTRGPMARCCGRSLCGSAGAAAPNVGERAHSSASVHAVCVWAALFARSPRWCQSWQPWECWSPQAVECWPLPMSQSAGVLVVARAVEC